MRCTKTQAFHSPAIRMMLTSVALYIGFSLGACGTQNDEKTQKASDALAQPADPGDTMDHASMEQPLQVTLRDVAIEKAEDGALLRITKLQTDPISRDDAVRSVTSGCTHIKYCNAPGPIEVECITNDKSTCTRAQRLEECFSDANYVCGRWNNMAFLPPI